MRRRRLIALVSAAVIGLPVVLLAAILVAGNTGWGRGWIADTVAAATADGPVRVELLGLSGVLPLRLRVERMRLADADGDFAELTGVELAWSPLALLTGTLVIDAVAVDSGRVDRLPTLVSGPEPVPAAPAPLPAFPELPLALRLDQLRLGEIRVGEAVAGRAAVLAAAFSASATGDAASAAGWLEARTTEGTARLDLDLAVVPRDGILRLALRATEPAGGLLAGLLGLDGRPALDLTLDGSGTLAAWNGRLAGGFGDGASVDLALTVGAEGGGHRLTVDGGLAAGSLLSASLRPLLGPSVGLGVTVVRAADGGVTVERAAVVAAAATLDGTARLDADGMPVAADVALRLPALAALAPAAGTDLLGAVEARLRLTDDGRRARLELAGSAAVEDTLLENLTLDLGAEADAPLATLPPSLRWTLRAAVDTPGVGAFDLPGLVGPGLNLDAAGTASIDGSAATVDRFALVAAAARIEGDARLADDGRIESALALILDDLAALSDLAGRPLAGAARLDVETSVALDPLDVSAILDLTTEEIDLGDPALAGLLGPAPGLGAGITFGAGGDLAVRGIDLRLAAARVGGDLDLDTAGGDLSGRLDLAAPDLAMVGRAIGLDLAGRAAVAVALGGNLEAPAASASWRLAPLSVAGTPLDAVTGTATVAGLPDAPAGRFDLRADAGGERLTLGADYRLAGAWLRITGLALDGAGLRGRGDLAVDLAGPLIDGDLTLAAPGLDRLAALAGLPPTAGSLDLRVALAAGDGQTARLSGSLADLAVGDGADAVGVASLALSGEGRRLFTAPAGTLRAELAGVTQGGATRVNVALLTAESDGAAARLAVSLEGEAGADYTLAATATAGFGGQPARVSLDTLDAKVADVVLGLERPLRVTLGPRPRFDELELRLDGGRITGAGSLDTANLDLTIAARGVPAALARLADPNLALDGGIDADLAVRGPIGDPNARLTLNAPGVRVVGPTHDDLPPLVASAEASVAQHRLAVAVDATVGEGALARFRLAAGLTPGTGGAPPALDQRAPMTAELVLDAALGRLTDYLPLEGTRIAGQAAARIDVTGTPTAPVVAGTASLAEGEIDQSDAGLYLRNVRLEARGDGGRLVIDTLSASAVSGGTLEGGGSIGFAAASAVPADLRLTARGLVAVDLDEATVPIDADLALTGSLPDYLLAGTVTVLPSEIRIPDQMPPSVMTLEVVEIRDGVVVAKPPEARPAEARSPIGLDLRINIPGQVFVRGRGLDSEWGGALTVSGRADAPVVRGEIAVRRGNLDAVGRSFGFGRGRILFDGGPPADPGLDMLLSTRVAEIEARIAVTGSARDPQIALSSEPTLPEEEVLSRILFGSPRAQLSPLQALRLAQSAAVLSGRLGSGGGIADTLRETLGVDTLDFDTGDDSGGGASLSVGRYVAPGVFLKLQQGLGGETSKAVVEVELTDSITVETDVGADSQSRVGVNWKLDY